MVQDGTNNEFSLKNRTNGRIKAAKKTKEVFLEEITFCFTENWKQRVEWKNSLTLNCSLAPHYK